MSFDIQKVKIVVMVPEDYLEQVRMVALDMGAGVIGNYTHCSMSTKCIGTFIPNDHANLFLGEMGKWNMQMRKNWSLFAMFL